MSRRRQWIVIALGGALLVGPALLERAASALAPAPEALRQQAERRDMRSVLMRANPRLGSDVAERILDSVDRCERVHALDPELVLRVLLVESMARPEARSYKGAIGLMQVMPYMFEKLEVPGNIVHIEANIEAGCFILADNIRRLGSQDGVSAYFWGSRIRGTEYLERVRTVLEGFPGARKGHDRGRG